MPEFQAWSILDTQRTRQGYYLSCDFFSQGSCPESLVACGQARLFGVAGSNPPGSASTSLSDSNVSVSVIHACGVSPLRSFSFSSFFFSFLVI